mgnify:CR=1 FL=1
MAAAATVQTVALAEARPPPPWIMGVSHDLVSMHHLACSFCLPTGGAADSARAQANWDVN